MTRKLKNYSIIVHVGSQNDVKVGAVKDVFGRIFTRNQVSVEGHKIPSGVSEMPHGADETQAGAYNRAHHLYKDMQKVITKDQLLFTVGIEGGVNESNEAYFVHDCVQVIGPELRTSSVPTGRARQSAASSDTYQLDDHTAEKVGKGNGELGPVYDKLFGVNATKQAVGGIGIMTHGMMTRQDVYAHLLIRAMMPWQAYDIYGVK